MTEVTKLISVGQWIVGVTSFQKIYDLYSVEHHKLEKWSYKVGCGWGLLVWWVCVDDGSVWMMDELTDTREHCFFKNIAHV